MAWFVLAPSALAVPALPETKTEMQAAEDLVLQGKRSEALRKLLVLWKKSAAENRVSIQDKMLELGSVFMTEKGQKQFELAQSLPLDKISLAEIQYDESLRGEDNNAKIYWAKVILRIREGDWKKAFEMLTTLRRVFPFHSGYQAAYLRVALQLGEEAGIDKVMTELKGGKPAPEVLFFKARWQISRMKLKNAEESLTNLEKTPGFAADKLELRFLLEKAKSGRGYAEARDYVDFCTKHSPLTQRQLTEDAFMCLDLSSAQAAAEEGAD